MIRVAIALVVFAALAAVHYPYLRLPYFWDELGQFIPASLDIFQTGDWIPVTTSPNIHPPGVMAYLALVWQVFGPSILATRLAMLALAAFGVLGSFLLAIRLGRGTPGYPALAAIAMLLVSPLFYAQSMLAQLDMPAMVFSVWALYLFLETRYGWSALACLALVMSKETGAILPAMFAAWLGWRRKKQSLYFLASIVPLLIWVVMLWRTTGNALGDSQFAQYNAVYSLHPVRLMAAVPRRLFYLFFSEFRWIGTIALFLAWRKTPAIFRTPEWTWAAAFGFLHILVVSVFGGAVLERYLMPVLPLVYAAMGCGFACLHGRLRFWAPGVACLGLMLSVTLGPPYLTPFENNIAFTDFVQLHEEAALLLNRLPARPERVATAWPLTDALRRPEFGYTTRPFLPIETTDFRTANVEKAVREKRPDAVVIYDRLHEPRWNLARIGSIRDFLTDYYGYAPQITSEELMRLGYAQVMRLEQRGQWIAIYVPR